MLRLLRNIRTLNNPYYHRAVTSTITTGYRQYSSDDLDLINLLQKQSDTKDGDQGQQAESKSAVNLADLLTSMKVDRTSASYVATPKDADKVQQAEAKSTANLTGSLTSMKVDKTGASDVTPQMTAANASVVDNVEDINKPIQQAANQPPIQKSKPKEEKKREPSKPPVKIVNRRDEILQKFQDITHWTPDYDNKIQDVSQYNSLMRYVGINPYLMITTCMPD